ncbi:unnamed protein product [Rangifer tarandus platyrhynchus]|uniref:Uncharacterized protein n=1 Tax=Rangifer tarandus platyrhynchus TaxID=3082113 RepID=A0AC59Y6Z1_RANTA
MSEGEDQLRYHVSGTHGHRDARGQMEEGTDSGGHGKNPVTEVTFMALLESGSNAVLTLNSVKAVIAILINIGARRVKHWEFITEKVIGGIGYAEG